MTVETRPARPEDVPEVARLVAAIAAYHESVDERARFDWEEIRQAPVWLNTVLARDHHALWVADAGAGHLVGYLWVRLLRDHQGYLPRVRGHIHHAYLEERWRGRGLMQPMLQAARDWFLSRDVTVVTLTVLHRNWIGSSAWYKLGYEDWTHERRLELKPRAK